MSESPAKVTSVAAESSLLRQCAPLTEVPTVASRSMAVNGKVILSRPAQGEKRRVLLVRLDQTLGDSAMNTPMLRELRAAYPDSHISLDRAPRNG